MCIVDNKNSAGVLWMCPLLPDPKKGEIFQEKRPLQSLEADLQNPQILNRNHPTRYRVRNVMEPTLPPTLSAFSTVKQVVSVLAKAQATGEGGCGVWWWRGGHLFVYFRSDGGGASFPVSTAHECWYRGLKRLGVGAR